MDGDRSGRDTGLRPPPAAPESLVELRDPSGVVLARWLCSPGRLDRLAIGWLLCEGIVASPDEVESLRVPGEHDVEVALRDAALRRLRERAASGAAGPAPPHLPAAIPAGPPRPGPDLLRTLDDPSRLSELFSQAFASATLRDAGGGVHTGARLTGGEIREVVEDVSRHAVVDRLAGGAVLDAARLDASAFLLSGRISAPIAAKLARAGVAAAATLSIPTTLAVEIASRSGVLLIGRARRGKPFRYGGGVER